MKTLKLMVVSLVCVSVLSACVVAPPRAKAKLVVTPNIKSVVVLEREHKNARVAVVKVKPAANRKCWKHAGHWHCHR